MNFDHTASRVLITGTAGSGKTTEFLRRLAADRSPFRAVFDPEREVSRKLGWPCVTDLAALAEHLARRRPVCFDPLDAPLSAGFDHFCRLLWQFAQLGDGVILMAADEAQGFTSTGKGGIPDSFAQIMQRGRRYEINVLLIAQSLGRVNDAVREQLSHILTFRHTDRLALEWLAGAGFDAAAVAALKYPGGWLCRNCHTGEIIKKGGRRK